MSQDRQLIHKRINITLPERTLRLLDRVARRGNRSRLIDRAVRDYVGKSGRARLRRRMIEGYRAGAREDLDIAAEWFVLEEDAWQKEPK